jgi:hypothetical protein
LWSGLGDERIAALAGDSQPLAAGLRRLGEQSVRACGPYSDNTSGAALRYLGKSDTPGKPRSRSKGQSKAASG